MTSESYEPLPIYQLFRKQTSQELIDFFMEHPDEWFRKSDIQEDVGMNHESVRQNLGSGKHPGILENYGIIERSAWDVNMPRYKLTESPVIDFLHEYDGYPFQQFFQTDARRRVFMYFIRERHNEETFTRNAVSENTDTNYEVVEDVMEQLKEAGAFKREDTGHAVKYEYIPDNQLEQDVITFNNIIYDTFHEITENYPEEVVENIVQS